MLKKVDKKFKEELIIIIIVFILIGYFVLENAYSIRDNNTNVATVSLKDRLDLLVDNYTIRVNKNLNGAESKLEINCGNGACIYTSDTFLDEGLLNYSDKWYTLSSVSDYDESSLIETNDEKLISNFESLYYDIDMLKAIVEKSEREETKDNTIYAHISLKNYLDEYNKIYNKSEVTSEETEIPIKIVLKNVMIDSIEIDYKNVDKYFNNSEYENYAYTIEFGNINANNFSSIEDYFNNYFTE